MPPWVSVRLAGVMEKVKSGLEAAVGGVVALGASCVAVPPPQATISNVTANGAMKIGDEMGLRTAVPLRWVDGSRASTLQSYMFICQVDKY